jgi:hypothetical protein
MPLTWEIILNLIEDPQCVDCPNKGKDGYCALTLPDDEDS